MAISDRTRKILWGPSGNLCAYCRRVLVEESTPHDAESVVGDECHIIGEKPTAARGALGVGRDDLDEYDNLLLLCKVHHKLVDDQADTYPVERLRELKSAGTICPSNPFGVKANEAGTAGDRRGIHTNYVGLNGSGYLTVRGNDLNPPINQCSLGTLGVNRYEHNGLFYFQSKVRFTDIADGTSNTLAVSEVVTVPDLASNRYDLRGCLHLKAPKP